MNIALNYFMSRLNVNIKIFVSNAFDYLKTLFNCCLLHLFEIILTLQWDIFNDRNDNTDVRMECEELLGTIAVDLNRKHFNDAFRCLTNELKDSNWSGEMG
ncbi:hypothetical protein RFI_04053 [Reticulomyxa filosa]|uniref:Uncharacterized protein n=1 Tax=Reticulomyxa filosa TaxID=46433 RepID=X6P3D8_RETFI|nr:hypothetical protein RFI_04053 [Reticulomyxa filosa]|eukprot:ETO33055.1 hypothetical protein RFI_04053 [Reticulomyxa filosa]